MSKVKNKRNGEISTLKAVKLLFDDDEFSVAKISGLRLDDVYKTINKRYEDYRPAESLIKDEKIRKAVRAWAEANGEEDNIVFTTSCEYSDYMFYTYGGGRICFEQGIDLDTGSYSIAELCGEEE